MKCFFGLAYRSMQLLSKTVNNLATVTDDRSCRNNYFPVAIFKSLYLKDHSALSVAEKKILSPPI